MKTPLLAVVFVLLSTFQALSQEYYFESKIMRAGRCGQAFSGAVRNIDTRIIINEGDRIIKISYADGTSGYSFKIAGVRPADDGFQSTAYQIQQDGQGFHTLMLDKDPLRKAAILMRGDGSCIFYLLD
jgi:hypothetical protein